MSFALLLACFEYFRNYVTPDGHPLNMSAFVPEGSMDHSQLEWLSRNFEEFHVIDGHVDLIGGKIYLRNERSQHPAGTIYWTANRLSRYISSLKLPVDQAIFLSMYRVVLGQSSFAHELSRLIPNRVITSEDFISLGNRGSISTSKQMPDI